MSKLVSGNLPPLTDAPPFSITLLDQKYNLPSGIEPTYQYPVCHLLAFRTIMSFPKPVPDGYNRGSLRSIRASQSLS